MASPQTLTLGALLRRYRTAAGLTQEELAEKAGMSVNAISAIERGVSRTPQRETIALLAEALNLQPAERTLFEQTARQRPSPVSAPRRHEAASAVGEHPFVGRATELAALDRFLAGEGAPLLLVAGEPGIGKSRLLRAVATRARTLGWTVLEGGCQRRSGQPPFAPLLDALAQHLASRSGGQVRADLQGASWLVRLLPELASTAVVPAPRWMLPPEQERRLMFGAVARYLANVAGPTGTLLVLDDLQWAGADALDLLGSLVAVARAAVAGQPLLLLGAYRSTEVHADHPLTVLLADLARDGLAADLPVGPLTSAEARSLLESLLGEGDEGDDGSTAARAVLIDRLLERAGGIPFYLASCARVAQAGAAHDDQDAQLDLTVALDAVPWDAAQTIRQRIALLPAGARELLGTAAIAGRRIERPVLEALIAWLSLDHNAGALVMAAAVQARLLLEAGGDAYRFAHDLIREVAAADLGTWRRRPAHRVIAEALEASLAEQERNLRAAELALHFARGGEIPRALPYLERAGELAQMRYANAEAERIYHELLRHYEEMDHPLDAARAAERLGKVLITVARDAEAIAVLTQAANAYHDAGDLESYARAMALGARAHSTNGTIDAGIAALESVARALDPGQPSPGAIAIHAGLTMLFWPAARYREQASAARQALEVARTLGTDREVVVWAESLHHAALLMLGHLTQSLPPLEAALPTLEARGDVDTLGWMLVHLGESYACLGRFDRFLVHMQRAGEVAELIGNPLNISYTCYWLGLHAFFIGNWQRAHEYFEHGREVAQPVATAEVRGSAAGYALLGLGQLSCARGEDERGGRYLEEALALARHGLPPRLLRPVQACLAERDLLAGRHSDVLVRLGPLLDVPEGREGIDATPLLPLLAWAYLASDLRRAEEVTAEALDRCRREQHQLALLDALRVRALLDIHQGRWDEAAAALDEALALARPMPYPYAEAKALSVYGQLHAAKGERALAQQRYQTGLAILHGLGERLYAQQIERALVEIDATST